MNGNIEEGRMRTGGSKPQTDTPRPAVTPASQRLERQKSPHQIAAEMLAGPDAWDRALNAELYDRISEAERLVRRAGGVLTSRQAIAAIIMAWRIQNPGEAAYGE